MNEPLIDALGWTLVHSLWQLTAIAALLWLALRFVAQDPRQRYAMACASLVMSVVVCIGTFVLLYDGDIEVAAAPGIGLLDVEWSWLSPTSVAASLVDDQSFDWRRPLVVAWLAGVLLLGCRLAWQCSRMHRLARHAVPLERSRWRGRIEPLAARYLPGRVLAILETDAILAPATIGWWKPVLLLPVGFATGLTPAQVELLVMHELAHIRRADYVINLLQSLVEATLFHHPAVWWMSRVVRVEREFCCDDQVVAARGDALLYARALTELESRRRLATLAVSSNGGSLMTRVRRLVAPEPRARARGAGLLALAVAMTGTLSIGLASTGDAVAEEGDAKCEPAPVEESVPMLSDIPLIANLFQQAKPRSVEPMRLLPGNLVTEEPEALAAVAELVTAEPEPLVAVGELVNEPARLVVGRLANDPLPGLRLAEVREYGDRFELIVQKQGPEGETHEHWKMHLDDGKVIRAKKVEEARGRRWDPNLVEGHRAISRSASPERRCTIEVTRDGKITERYELVLSADEKFDVNEVAQMIEEHQARRTEKSHSDQDEIVQRLIEMERAREQLERQLRELENEEEKLRGELERRRGRKGSIR